MPLPYALNTSWVTGRVRSGTDAFTAHHAEPLHYGHHIFCSLGRPRSCVSAFKEPRPCQLDHQGSFAAQNSHSMSVRFTRTRKVQRGASHAALLSVCRSTRLASLKPLSERSPALSPSVGSRARGAPLLVVRQRGFEPRLHANQACVLLLNDWRKSLCPVTELNCPLRLFKPALVTMRASGAHRPGWCPGFIVVYSIFKDRGHTSTVDREGVEPPTSRLRGACSCPVELSIRGAPRTCLRWDSNPRFSA